MRRLWGRTFRIGRLYPAYTALLWRAFIGCKQWTRHQWR
jgi:hypothetical protein